MYTHVHFSGVAIIGMKSSNCCSSLSDVDDDDVADDAVDDNDTKKCEYESIRHTVPVSIKSNKATSSAAYRPLACKNWCSREDAFNAFFVTGSEKIHRKREV
jgi:hypothetical protein